MSQDKNFDRKAEKVEAAYRDAANSKPSPKLDAAILKLAEQQAEQTRSRNLKLAPFSAHNRLTGLSIAASMILAVSLVVVMQREVPDQISLEQPSTLPAVSERGPTEKEQTFSSNSDQLMQDKHTDSATSEQKTEIAVTTRQAELFSSDTNNTVQPAAPTVKRERQAIASRSIEMDTAPLAGSADFETPSSEPATAKSPVAANRHRTKAETKRPDPTTRIFKPALKLKNLSSSNQLADAEKVLLMNTYRQSQVSIDEFLLLWSAESKTRIAALLMHQNNWDRYQALLEQAKIIARIERNSHIIFVLNQEDEISGLKGTLSINKKGSIYRLDFLPQYDPKLLERIKALRQANLG